jgi:hypothetical protein
MSFEHYFDQDWHLKTQYPNLMTIQRNLSSSLTMPGFPYVFLLATSCAAAGFDGFNGHRSYPLPCALACRAAIAGASLACTPEVNHVMHGGHHGPATTSDCYASDTPFLTTLAHCMETECGAYNVPGWQLERYWEEAASGSPLVAPKWTYSEALANISAPPTNVLGHHETLNVTSLANPEMYSMQFNFMNTFNVVNARMNIYT